MKRPKPAPLTLLAALLLYLTLPPLLANPKNTTPDFNRDIRPILSDKCFFCHGFDAHERKADLRLDTPEGAAPVLKSENNLPSEFLHRITTSDQDDLMPPPDSHKTLTKKEIQTLTTWINNGAPYQDPWPYVPPKKTKPKTISDPTWPKNWIDHHILAKLDTENLSPSPDADPTTLIRRLHFDLIGLPPTPERVTAFKEQIQTHNLDTAIETLVDELLASPHFGERMAIYWLDLVRFADTVGYHGDQTHNIYPYRDYVIQSFNTNLPFDQFTREQLAGDLLPNPTLSQKIATGYNRLLQTSHEGGIQEKEYNAIYAADRVRNLSAVWMGATVGCAQCHDHKYDPYSIKDHYALAAFFADIHDKGYTGNANPTTRPPEIQVPSKEQQQDLKKIEQTIKKLKEMDRAAKTLEGLYKKMEQAKGEQKEKLKKELDPLLKSFRNTGYHPSTLKAIEKEKTKLLSQIPKTMITVASTPRPTRILPRGDWLDDTGDIVQPAVPAFLPQIQTKNRPTRLHLANWLTDATNGVGGLTARVMVNRYWYLFFGTGISTSLEDFGGQGQPPANPELLDALALRYLETGWNTKALIRDLVTSRAYRQSSLTTPELLARDPQNQLLARQSRYRLPAEIIRDTALATSGLLNPQIGGPSIRPYQPPGYYRHLNFPKREYKPDTAPKNQHRRGLYVHWQRQFLHPMMKAMDAPTREECTAQRPKSNTPVAALVLLNDPTFLEAAQALATRTLKQSENPEPVARLATLYNLVLNRPPDPTEQKILTTLLTQTKTNFTQNPKNAKASLINPDKTLDPITLATWTTLTRALLNLNETTTRN